MATKEQAMTALELANTVRRARAKAFKDFKEGRLTFEKLLDHEHVQTATIYRVLIQRPHYGRSRVRRLLRVLVMSESLQVRSMSERQRSALLEAFNPKEKK